MSRNIGSTEHVVRPADGLLAERRNRGIKGWFNIIFVLVAIEGFGAVSRHRSETSRQEGYG